MKFMIKTIWGIIPVPVFVTDWGLGPTVGGCANSFIIRIRPKYIDRKDEGILNHELNHVKQFFMPLLISLSIFAALWVWLGYISEYSLFIIMAGYSFHGLMYLLVKPYKLWSEVTSYRVQAKSYPNYEEKLEEFAGYISKYYKLDITPENALKELKKT